MRHIYETGNVPGRIVTRIGEVYAGGQRRILINGYAWKGTRKRSFNIEQPRFTARIIRNDMLVTSIVAGQNDRYLRAIGGAESMPPQIQSSILDVENSTIRSIDRDISCQPQITAD